MYATCMCFCNMHACLWCQLHAVQVSSSPCIFATWPQRRSSSSRVPLHHHSKVDKTVSADQSFSHIYLLQHPDTVLKFQFSFVTFKGLFFSTMEQTLSFFSRQLCKLKEGHLPKTLQDMKQTKMFDVHSKRNSHVCNMDITSQREERSIRN